MITISSKPRNKCFCVEVKWEDGCLREISDKSNRPGCAFSLQFVACVNRAARPPPPLFPTLDLSFISVAAFAVPSFIPPSYLLIPTIPYVFLVSHCSSSPYIISSNKC